MIEVRHAKRDDMKALALIQVSSWKKGFENILSKETLEKYTNFENCQIMLERFYDSKSGYFYIAYREEKPCAELFWCEGKEIDESAEIVALHSIPESWGHGVGKAIMDKATDDIKAKGYNTFIFGFSKKI